MMALVNWEKVWRMCDWMIGGWEKKLGEKLSLVEFGWDGMVCCACGDN